MKLLRSLLFSVLAVMLVSCGKGAVRQSGTAGSEIFDHHAVAWSLQDNLSVLSLGGIIWL